MTTASPLSPADLSPSTARRWLLAIALLALTLRLLVAFGIGHQTPHIYDELSYDEIGGKLAATGSFAIRAPAEKRDENVPGRPTSLRPPLYPALLAAVYKFRDGHDFLAARVLQAVLGALTVLPLFMLATGMFSRRVAVVAAALFALEPSLVGYCGLLLSETLFTLLVVLACLMIQRLLADGRFLWAVLFGVAAGLGALTRSLLLPIVPLLLLYLCAVLREWKWPRRLALAAAAGAAFFAVVGPWIVRNTRLERTFTTIDCIGGRNLMMGNYEHTPLLRSWDTITMLSGTGRAWDDILMQEHPQFAKLSQGQRDKVAMRHGLRFALAHPGLTLKRSTVKFFDFWQLERTLIAGMKAGWWGDVSRPVLLAAAAVMSGYGAAVLLLAALGFCLTRPRDMRVHWFILLVIVLCAGVHTVIFAHSRYRLPLTPLMIIYSASALCAWRGGQIRWHNWRFAAACAIGMVLVGCWIAQFVVYDMQRFS